MQHFVGVGTPGPQRSLWGAPQGPGKALTCFRKHCEPVRPAGSPWTSGRQHLEDPKACRKGTRKRWKDGLPGSGRKRLEGAKDAAGTGSVCQALLEKGGRRRSQAGAGMHPRPCRRKLLATVA